MRIFGLILGCACLLALGFFGGQATKLGKKDGTPGRPSGYGRGGGSGPPRGGGDRPTSRPSQAATPVVTAPALLASIRERISGSGLLEAEREVTVIARVDGQVESLGVEAGEEVELDKVLCAIDQSSLKIAELQARIQRDQDETDYQRMLDLSKQNRSVVSSKEVEDSRFKKDQSRAAHEQALLDLSYSEPKAPFSGTIVKRFVDKGQFVRSGDSLFSIADFHPLLLKLYLPEADVARVAVGQVAELRPERDAPMVAEGNVLRVSPVVDPESLNVEVTASFDQVPSTLRPGSFARVDVITRTYQDVILVPRAAVIRRKGEPSFLFRILPNQHVQRVEVKTGYEDEAVVEVIESGLSAGDLVVVEGNRELEDNGLVQVYGEIPVKGNPLSVSPQEMNDPSQGSTRDDS